MSANANKMHCAAKEYNIIQSPYYSNNYDRHDLSSHYYNRNATKISQPQETPILQGSRKSTSKAKSEFNYSKSANSNYTASIKNRIEKACTTSNKNDLIKQNALLTKQIEKLEKQLLKRDQQIIQMRTQVMPTKQTKTEILELYRALNYFQGKTKQMQSEIYKFREMILKAPSEGVTADNLNVLFEDLRIHNEELSGQIQQIQYIKMTVQDNYNRLKVKYFDCQRQLSEYKRKQNSPLEQYYISKGITTKAASNRKINMIFNHAMSKNAPTQIQLKQKQLVARELQSKLQQSQKKMNLFEQQIQKLHKQIDKLKVQNQMLMNDLDDKNKQITQLFKEYMIAKKSLKKLESQFFTDQVIPKSGQKYHGWTPSFKTAPQYGSINNI